MFLFAANLPLLFNEVDFAARFERAAEADLEAVECLLSYPWDALD